MVPEEIETNERPYITQLIQVYSDHKGIHFSDENDLAEETLYVQNLIEQRRRYYDAEAFNRHFRDNIAEETLLQFTRDIFDGVYDEYLLIEGMERVSKVMKTAGNVQVSGVFGKHSSAPVSVKQGVCHQLANVGKLPWKV